LLSKIIKTKKYTTIILSVVLYRFKTWSLTLREEDRLRVFENRVLRRIFGPKRDKVTWEWRRLHNEELMMCSSANIRRMRWARHVACMGDRRGAYSVMVGRPQGNRSLERSGHRWEDNIKKDHQ
jgi:hypothetical protein